MFRAFSLAAAIVALGAATVALAGSPWPVVLPSGTGLLLGALTVLAVVAVVQPRRDRQPARSVREPLPGRVPSRAARAR
jgi:heme A synthase